VDNLFEDKPLIFNRIDRLLEGIGVCYLLPKLSDSMRGRMRENGLAHRLMAGAKRNRTPEMESLMG
jgi:hypothetical protein